MEFIRYEKRAILCCPRCKEPGLEVALKKIKNKDWTVGQRCQACKYNYLAKSKEE